MIFGFYVVDLLWGVSFIAVPPLARLGDPLEGRLLVQKRAGSTVEEKLCPLKTNGHFIMKTHLLMGLPDVPGVALL